jgi:LPXTG-motif cell wall-anchored protein
MIDQAATRPTRPSRRRRPGLAIASLLGGVALALGVAAPAMAEVSGDLTVGSATLTAGDTTTVTATFTLTGADPQNVALRIAGDPALGRPTLSSVTTTGQVTLASCTVLPNLIGCPWVGPAGDGAVATISATISTSAVGTWTIEAFTQQESLGGVVVLRSVPLTVTPAYTATFGVQSPSPAPPSSTLLTTATFTRSGTSDVSIGVDLEGTGGEGTLSKFTTSGGGVCTATSDRGFRCPWPTGDPNTVTLTFDVNVGAGAVPPDWTLRAVLSDGSATARTLATRSVVIQPTTTAPTTAAPTTTVAAPTTTVAGAGGAVTTAAASGGLPATGPSTATTTALLGAVLLAGGVTATFAARRRAD